MVPGDTFAAAHGDGDDNGDDLSARLADPVLAGLRAEATAPVAEPPEVWGGLARDLPGLQDAIGPPPSAIEERALDLLDQMTVHEKLHLLSGDGPVVRSMAELVRGRDDGALVVAGALPRLGIPGIRFLDGPAGGPHGCTPFPAPVARAATFAPDLEERVGDALGAESRALGANLFPGVCANVLRHPAWGRAEESYGEDPHLVAEMAAAAVRGVRGHVMAGVRHLACASVEDARHRVDITVDDDDLRDLYLVAFRRCVDEGASAITTGANSLDGERCGHHRHLLTDIVKGEWGFDGFVMSDLLLGVRSASAVAAGLDLEVPVTWRFRALGRLVRQGRVESARVDDAAQRLLRHQIRGAVGAARAGDEQRARWSPTTVGGDAHRALAREVAERSMVLLRNATVRARRGDDGRDPGPAEPVLPLDPHRVQSVAVLGRSAASPVSGPRRAGPDRRHPVVTALDGLRAAGDRWVINVTHQPGDDLDAARLAATVADVAVVVAGLDRDGGGTVLRRPRDRRSLALTAHDEALIRTVGAANPRTVVVLMGASAVVTESWREQVGAVLVAWDPGVEGGHALARVLFGEVTPGGRLPCTWPRGAEQLPDFDPEARRLRYGPLWGYRLMEATGRSPAFPFGFGLSYTTFEYGRPDAKRGFDGTVWLTVPVVNTGTRVGDEVVQVYVDEARGSDHQPLRTLRAFRRVTVAPGAIANVTFELGADTLARAPRTEGGKVRLHVGRDADPAHHRAVDA